MGLLPTVDDVARVAHVSRQTVSNVINSPDIVRPDTRKRVESAIAKLGYRPHASARRLRTQKSSTIGIRLDPMTNGISGSVLDRFLHALTEQADERGMRVLIFTATDPESEIRQIRKLRDGADVDAFVLTSTFYGDKRTEWLIEHHVPFVTFGRPWGIDDMNDPQHLWVDVDGFAGLHEATTDLAARGARRIGYVGWPSPSGTGDDRRRGWETAMTEQFAGAADLDLLSVAVEDDVESARTAVAGLLERARPDALVCASDSLALGALMAASGPGLADVPIIGYDNTPVAQAVGLSSVEQPLNEVAAGALELLMGDTGNTVIHRGGDDPRHRLITPKLVSRRSTHLARYEDDTATVTKSAAGNHK
ncbi:LacI family DNA-binding transcriptional regulator [Glaciibacter sp. 2TAF33]|uniref:LacI family DNA-binding transcriptional regulator n=1 Tax=Glaciibacter sp. 2TAF33 TaxID=3233015 RepID=UPI003F906EFA